MGEDVVGYTIGFPELYQEVRVVGDRLSEYMARQDLISTSQEHKISELTRDLDEIRDRLEQERTQRASLNRQLWLAFLSSAVFPVLVMAFGFIVMKGS